MDDLDRIKNERHVERITCGMLNSFDEPREYQESLEKIGAGSIVSLFTNDHLMYLAGSVTLLVQRAPFKDTSYLSNSMRNESLEGDDRRQGTLLDPAFESIRYLKLQLKS
jgi:hypothetical protein